MVGYMDYRELQKTCFPIISGLIKEIRLMSLPFYKFVKLVILFISFGYIVSIVLSAQKYPNIYEISFSLLIAGTDKFQTLDSSRKSNFLVFFPMSFFLLVFSCLWTFLQYTKILIQHLHIQSQIFQDEVYSCKIQLFHFFGRCIVKSVLYNGTSLLLFLLNGINLSNASSLKIVMKRYGSVFSFTSFWINLRKTSCLSVFPTAMKSVPMSWLIESPVIVCSLHYLNFTSSTSFFSVRLETKILFSSTGKSLSNICTGSILTLQDFYKNLTLSGS